jgi:hypothetical protein
MHGVTPRSILGQAWWNKTRKAAYESTIYRCLACGIRKREAKGPKWLEGHEVYSIDYLHGRMCYIETVPLCNYCHGFLHDGRMRALLEKGEITHQKFALVMRHGEAVLVAAGLERAPYEDRQMQVQDMLLNGFVAPWRDWRLILDGHEYPPKYKSEEHWRKAMER